MDEQSVDEYLAQLLELGALELDVMENGDVMYRTTALTETLAPEFYQAHLDEISDDLLSLYNKGLVSITYDENLEPLFGLTDLGQQYVAQALEDEYGESIRTDSDSTDR